MTSTSHFYVPKKKSFYLFADILDAYRGVIEQRSGYQKALSEERYKLDSKLEEALRDVDKLYDEIITR